jgi:hypothetical protein
MKVKEFSSILLLGLLAYSTVSAQVPRGPQGLQTKTITLNKAAFNQSFATLGQTPGPDGLTFAITIEVPTQFNGTFAGESICVRNRTACKNDRVVYVLEKGSQDSGEILLTSDFIQSGRRIPFFRQKLQYDPATKFFNGRFLTARETLPYRYWEYRVVSTGELGNVGPIYTLTITATDANNLEGTVSAQDKTVLRRLKLKRVKPNQVPPAPSPSMYPSL